MLSEEVLAKALHITLGDIVDALPKASLGSLDPPLEGFVDFLLRSDLGVNIFSIASLSSSAASCPAVGCIAMRQTTLT
jgi:hypothetical protein